MSFSSAPPSPTDAVSTYDRPSRRQDFQIAIICALSLEFDAAMLLVDEFWDQDGRQYGRTSGDTNIYRNGRIGMHNVVLMLLPNMGKAAVAGSAASLRTSYLNLKLALLVGVCGGVPTLGSHEALLGDVVIGEAIVQYDFGRRYPGEFIPKEATETSLSPPNKDIRSFLAYFKSDAGKDDLRRNTANNLIALQDAAVTKHYQRRYRYPGVSEDKLFAAIYRHKHGEHSPCDLCRGENERICDEAAQASCVELGCDEDKLILRKRLELKRDLEWEEAQCPDIIIGRIASGDTVMKSGDHRDQIAKRYGIMAFEMEGAGLWDEAPCIVVKGICDYADSHKNKIWQPFAAATAAATVKAMLERYNPTDYRTFTISTYLDQQGHAPSANLEITNICVKQSSPTSALVQPNGSPTLWDAIFDFQSALNNDQLQELRNDTIIPDADAVLVFTAQLDLLNRNRKGGSIASRLHSVLQSVRDFSAVVETFVSIHRGTAPLLWGSVKLTMITAVESNIYFGAFSKLFMDLGGFFPRWTEYQILYPSSIQLQKALCGFYLSLVRCCKRMVETMQRTWSSYVFSPLQESFEREFKWYGDDIRRCSAYVKEALSMAQTQADFQNQQLQSRRRKKSSMGGKLKRFFPQQDERSNKMKTWQTQSDERRTKERRQRLLDSLSTYDYLTSLNQNRKKRYRGTSEWLFKTREFDHWLNCTDSPLLWCYGKIGSGKTTLTASVIEKLLTLKCHPNIFISFFFVRFDDRHSLNAEAILKSVIRQTLNHLGLSQEIEALLEQMQLSLSAGLKNILQLLQKIVIGFKMLYIVIDGIDECEKKDREDLLHVLSELATIGSNTKLFLASRDSVSREIQKRFPTFDRISLNCSAAQSDIATYVEGIVHDKLRNEELIVGDSRLIEEIKVALIEGADGMFLWVAFQIDELGLQHCDDDIRKAICNFPKDLEETFDRAVGRIVSRGNEKIAQQVFRWVAAVKEPLSLDQLKEVIFIEIGQKYSMPERQSNGIHNISAWCENLVYVDEELKTVQFAHQTVRQFFLDKASKARNNQFYLRFEDADHYVGDICVTYLNFNDFKTAVARRHRPLPPMPPTAIASIALRHQWKAAASIPKFLKSSLGTQVGLAVSDTIESLSTFQQNDTRDTKERLQVEYPFLRYASAHWILHTTKFQKKSRTWNLWEKMILHGHDLVEKPWGEGSFSTSSSLILEWSLKIQHYALIRLVLLIGMHSTANRKRIMQKAVSEGDVTLLDIILEDEKPGYELDQACIAAAKCGQVNIIKRLLASGADVNVAPAWDSGRTALQAAAEGGHLDVIDRLLASGADVNAAPAWDSGRTALQAAAEGGHLDVIERLLASGADINAPAGKYGITVLQAAARGGHPDVIDRLLASRADVNAAPAWDSGQKALQAATQEGYLNIVSELKLAGAKEESILNSK